MKYIFENAYFGKAYRTRNGMKAILIHVKSLQIISEDLTEYIVTEDGYAYDDMSEDYDIIGEWKEEVDDIEICKLALIENPNIAHSKDPYEVGLFYGFNNGFNLGFKAGHRKQ